MYNIRNVMDDRPETVWVPDCVPPYGTWTGCVARDPWIGYDFGFEPKTVRCMRIYQSDAFVATEDRATHVSGLVIQ